MRAKYQRRTALRSEASRFWRFVRTTDECWLWTGALTTSGYPVWSGPNRQTLASKFAWYLKYGRNPNRRLKRICGNVLCVRPQHMSEDLKPKPAKPVKTFYEKFFSRVGFPNEKGCWPWLTVRESSLGEPGSVYQHYGYFQGTLAHRISYEIYKGPISEDKMVLHTCDMPHCVNPQHLYEGDAKANAQDRQVRGRHRVGAPVSEHERQLILSSHLPTSRLSKVLGKTFTTVLRVRRDPLGLSIRIGSSTECPNGHQKTEENTYVSPAGQRNCRPCNVAATKRYRTKKQAGV